LSINHKGILILTQKTFLKILVLAHIIIISNIE